MTRKDVYHILLAGSILLVLFLLSGCRTQREYIIQHDTLHVERTKRDSIYLHDSIHVKEYQKGDTFFCFQDRWHTMYRDVVKRDSIYIHKTDTIQTVKVEKVEKKLAWWQRIAIRVGNFFMIAWVIFICFGFWGYFRGK